MKKLLEQVNNFIQSSIRKILNSQLIAQLKNSRVKNLIIIGVVIISVIIIYNVFFRYTPEERKQLKNSIYCNTNSDCQLYDCTSCGNKLWIDKKIKDNNCDKSVQDLIGCGCIDHVCKRIYKKQ